MVHWRRQRAHGLSQGSMRVQPHAHGTNHVRSGIGVLRAHNESHRPSGVPPRGSDACSYFEVHGHELRMEWLVVAPNLSFVGGRARSLGANCVCYCTRGIEGAQSPYRGRGKGSKCRRVGLILDGE